MGGDDFFGGGRTIMPVVIVFHKRHAFAFGRVGDDHGRFAVVPETAGDGVGQCADVVTVDFTDVPTERFPFSTERFDGHNVIRAAGGLPFVVVDHDAEIVEPM